MGVLKVHGHLCLIYARDTGTLIASNQAIHRDYFLLNVIAVVNLFTIGPLYVLNYISLTDVIFNTNYYN